MSDRTSLFGDWLGDELDRQSKSRRWLAIEIGVHPETVSRWVDNEAIPEPANCLKIADALRVDRDAVLDIAGHRPETNTDLAHLDPRARLFFLRYKDLPPDVQRRWQRQMDLLLKEAEEEAELERRHGQKDS